MVIKTFKMRQLLKVLASSAFLSQATCQANATSLETLALEFYEAGPDVVLAVT